MNDPKYVETKLPEVLAENYRVFMHKLCCSLVQEVADYCHEGHVPADKDAFIEEMVEQYYSTPSRHIGGLTTAEWVAKRTELAAYLRDAVDAIELTKKKHWRN